MKIRLYAEKDREECIEIFKQNIGRSFVQRDLPLFKHWLDNHLEYPYFVVEMNKRIVACGGVYFDHRYNMPGLSWGMVNPVCQKKGVGKKFAEFRIEQISNAFPDSKCFIETTQHAVAFYVKLGFKVRKFERNGFSLGTDRYFLEYIAA